MMGFLINIFLVGILHVSVNNGQNFKPNIWSIDTAPTNNVSGITFFHDSPTVKNNENISPFLSYPDMSNTNNNAPIVYPGVTDANNNTPDTYLNIGTVDTNPLISYPNIGTANTNTPIAYPTIDTSNNDAPMAYPDIGNTNNNKPISYPDIGNTNNNKPISYPDIGNINNKKPISYPDIGNTNNNKPISYPAIGNAKNNNKPISYPNVGNTNSNPLASYPDIGNTNNNAEISYLDVGNTNTNTHMPYPDISKSNNNAPTLYPGMGDNTNNVPVTYPNTDNNNNADTTYHDIGNKNKPTKYSDIDRSNNKTPIPYPTIGTTSSGDRGSGIPIISMKTALGVDRSGLGAAVLDTQSLDLSQLGILDIPATNDNAVFGSTHDPGARNEATIARTSNTGLNAQLRMEQRTKAKARRNPFPFGPLQGSRIAQNALSPHSSNSGKVAGNSNQEKGISAVTKQHPGNSMGFWKKTQFEDHSKKALLRPKHKFIDMSGSGIKPSGVFIDLSKVPTDQPQIAAGIAIPGVLGMKNSLNYPSADKTVTANDVNRDSSSTKSRMNSFGFNKINIEGTTFGTDTVGDPGVMTGEIPTMSQDGGSNTGTFVDLSTTDTVTGSIQETSNSGINILQNELNAASSDSIPSGDNLKVDSLYPVKKSTEGQTDGNGIQPPVTIQSGTNKENSVSGDRNGAIRTLPTEEHGNGGQLIKEDNTGSEPNDNMGGQGNINGVDLSTGSTTGRNTNTNGVSNNVLNSAKNNDRLKIDNGGVAPTTSMRPINIPTNMGVFPGDTRIITTSISNNMNNGGAASFDNINKPVTINPGTNISPITNSNGRFPLPGPETNTIPIMNGGQSDFVDNVGTMPPIHTNPNSQPTTSNGHLGVSIGNGGIVPQNGNPINNNINIRQKPSQNTIAQNNWPLTSNSGGNIPSFNSGQARNFNGISNSEVTNMANGMPMLPGIPSVNSNGIANPLNVNRQINQIPARQFGAPTSNSGQMPNFGQNQFRNSPSMMNQPRVTGFVRVSGPTGPILVPQSGMNNINLPNGQMLPGNFLSQPNNLRNSPPFTNEIGIPFSNMNTMPGQNGQIPFNQISPQGVPNTRTNLFNTPINEINRVNGFRNGVQNGETLTNGIGSQNNIPVNIPSNQNFPNGPQLANGQTTQVNFQNSRTVPNGAQMTNGQTSSPVNIPINQNFPNGAQTSNRQTNPTNFPNNGQQQNINPNGQTIPIVGPFPNNQRFPNSQNGQNIPNNIQIQNQNLANRQNNPLMRTTFPNDPNSIQTGQNRIVPINNVPMGISIQEQRFMNRFQNQIPFAGSMVRNGAQQSQFGRGNGPLFTGQPANGPLFPGQQQFGIPPNRQMMPSGNFNQFPSNNFQMPNMPFR